MNALFYFSGYHFKNNEWWRFLITVADGPHDRWLAAKDLISREYPELNRWSGEFICLTPEYVFKEV